MGEHADIQFIVVDVETSGLDHTTDELLEIGMAALDSRFVIVDSFQSLVAPFLNKKVEKVRDECPEVVWEMHNSSGLWKDLIEAEANGILPSALNVQRDAMVWLESLGPEPNTMPMTGNSLRLDRAFIRESCLAVDNWFNHRIIDVSSIRILAEKWNKAAYDSAPESMTNHRVERCIFDTIMELKHYRHSFLLGENKVKKSARAKRGIR